MAKTQAPRALEVAAALRLFGVKAVHIKSPKGGWVVHVQVGTAIGYILPLPGKMFKFAKPRGKPKEIEGSALLRWVVDLK